MNGSIYFLTRNKGLFRSVDRGQTFQPISNITESAGLSITFVAAVQYYKMGIDDRDPRIIYLTTGSGLYKTTDDGRSWTLLNLPVKKEAQIPRAVASAQGGVLAYTSIGSTIFKTSNGGQSWQTQGLPTQSMVNTILIDPFLPQVTYAGLITR